MSEVGLKVQQAIDLMNSGSYELAFLPAADAIQRTVEKALGKIPDEIDYQSFFRENWQFIVFMGMPHSVPLAMNIPFGVKRIIPSFNIHHGALEIVSLAVTETLKLQRMPEEFGVNSTGKFDVKDAHVLLPVGLVCGLLGSVIFHPLNKDEAIGDQYWISISDFKMFVSELFGRKDLAERIMRFYER